LIRLRVQPQARFDAEQAAAWYEGERMAMMLKSSQFFTRRAPQKRGKQESDHERLIGVVRGRYDCGVFNAAVDLQAIPLSGLRIRKLNVQGHNL
jgi:hypothetical protein